MLKLKLFTDIYISCVIRWQQGFSVGFSSGEHEHQSMTATPYTVCQHKAGTVLHQEANYTRIMSDGVWKITVVTNSCEGTLACKGKCVSIQGETITDPLPNCSPRLLQTLSRLSHVQVNQLHLWGERATKCYPRCTAVSTGPANGAFMLAVLSLLHPCVWENRHECTIVSIFNHRLNDRSVKKLRDRQITQREMLQQFPNMRLSVCVCMCVCFPFFFFSSYISAYVVILSEWRHLSLRRILQLLSGANIEVALWWHYWGRQDKATNSVSILGR